MVGSDSRHKGAKPLAKLDVVRIAVACNFTRVYTRRPCCYCIMGFRRRGFKSRRPDLSVMDVEPFCNNQLMTGDRACTELFHSALGRRSLSRIRDATQFETGRP
jgi:hypothetical protein